MGTSCRTRRLLPLVLTPALLVSLAPLLGPGCATSDLPNDIVLPPNYELKHTDIQRPSGLRVLIEEDHSSPLVVVSATFGVGGTSDPKGSEGLAHFIEHLVFRARPGGGDQVWDRLKRSGGSFNASTAADETNYYVIAHKDELRTLMEIQAWRLLDPLAGVTQDVFDTEREVVRNELRQRFETTVGNRVFDLVLDQLFPPGHPLHRPIAGNHKTLQHATLAEAHEFVAKYYVPENCTIVIAGDVDAAEVKRLIGTWPAQLHFAGGNPAAPPVPHRPRIAEMPTPEVPPPYKTELRREVGSIAQPQLILGMSMPGAHRRDDAFLEYAAVLLNISLRQNLAQHEDDDIENVGASPLPLADASVMMVYANLRPGADPEKARKRIMDALIGESNERLASLVPRSKWDRASGLLLEVDDPVGRALALADHLHATGNTQYFKDSFDGLNAISTTELMDFVGKWLRPERAVAIYIEPESTTMTKSTSNGPSGGESKASGHEVGQGDVGDLAALGSAQILKIAASPDLAKIPHFTLATGLPVYVAHHGSAPVARLTLSLRGGNAMARPNGLASLSQIFVRPHCPMYAGLDAVGGNIYGGAGETSSSMRVDVASGNLANALAALSDAVTCMEPNEDLYNGVTMPGFDFYGIEQIMKSRKKQFERSAKRPEFLAQKTLWSALYPNHPYGDFVADPNELEKVPLDKMASYMQSEYVPGNGALVIVGDVDTDNARKLAEKYLARWNGSSSPTLPLAPAVPMPAPEKRKIFVIDRPGATQGVVSLACRLEAQTPETVAAYDLASHLVDGQAWKIREEKGATYGIHAGISRMPGGASHLMMSGAVESTQVGFAVGRLFDIIAKLGKEPVDEPVFLRARWDVAREFSARYVSGNGIAGGILQALSEGWPVDVWDHYPERLAAMKATDVAKALAPCSGKEILVIVGDGANLRKQLTDAGLTVEP